MIRREWLTIAASRLHQDYLGTGRLSEYAELIAAARTAGYELISLASFHGRASQVEGRGQRWLALRHDVDISDVAGNEAFYAAELAAGARSTFYFRLSTAQAHRHLIRKLLGDGFEVGYHFEEAATIAKRGGLRSRAQVDLQRDRIDDMFRQNCAEFRRRWNPDLSSVASHGDWINRRLAFTNNEYLSGRLLADCGLQFEAYGDDMLGIADIYISDVAASPERWAGGRSLSEALVATRHPIYMLTHERRWHIGRRASAAADLERVIDGLRYRLRRRSTGERDGV